MTSRWSRAFAIACAGVVALALAGCGERPQVVNYKQGRYQGKPDTPPWQNDQFKSSKQEWDNAIRTRNQHQNEYKRVS
jgi:hypothetical protein